MRALKGVGTLLAGIASALVLVFLMALYIRGLVWVSKNVHAYLDVAVIITFAVLRFRSSALRVVPRDTKIFREWLFYFVRYFRRVCVDFGFLSDAPVLGRDRYIRRRHHGCRRYRATWDAGLSIPQ